MCNMLLVLLSLSSSLLLLLYSPFSWSTIQYQPSEEFCLVCRPFFLSPCLIAFVVVVTFFCYFPFATTMETTNRCERRKSSCQKVSISRAVQQFVRLFVMTTLFNIRSKQRNWDSYDYVKIPSRWRPFDNKPTNQPTNKLDEARSDQNKGHKSFSL